MLIKKLLKNMSYSVASNGVSLLVSVVMVLLLPKFLSNDVYGQWQLFLFFCSYLGFFHLGWEDGIYLRYAGSAFEELPYSRIGGQILGITLLQIGFIIIFLSFSQGVLRYVYQHYILLSAAIPLMLLANLYNLCSFLLQITNRIREYAITILSGRIILGIGILVCIFSGWHAFNQLYITYIISLLLPLLLGWHWCRRCFVWPHGETRSGFWKETKDNLSAGGQLMLSNIAGMLLVGIIRYGISYGWDISTFGKVSLALNISNFLLVFISAVSVAVFPLIKRLDFSSLKRLYGGLRSLMSYGLLGLMCLYFPIYSFLFYWLPKYRDALVFMILLFPICLYESKVQILSNTYFKSLRKEKLMLKINFFCVILSIFITFISVNIIHNLWVAVFSIFFVYALRSIVSEILLTQMIGIKIYIDMVIELVYIITFMFIGVLSDTLVAMGIYGALYLLLIRYKWKDIKIALSNLRSL